MFARELDRVCAAAGGSSARPVRCVFPEVYTAGVGSGRSAPVWFWFLDDFGLSVGMSSGPNCAAKLCVAGSTPGRDIGPSARSHP